MKILQFIASSEWGGAEDSFVNICNELSKTQDIVVILTNNNVIQHKLASNIQIYILSSHSNRYNPLLLFELFLLIRKLSPNIIHTHGAKATELIYISNYFLNIPHVGTKHNSRKGKIFNKLKYVTAVSRNVAKTISAPNIKIIYNGIQPVHPLHEKTKCPYFIIQAIGRLHPVKGFERLINAVRHLSFPFQLEIIGEGEQRQYLETLIHQNHLNDHVKLLGYQNNIAQTMTHADLIVISSYTEGFSLVLVESLFYASVLISTKVSGSTEILPDSLLYDPETLVEKIQDIYLHYAYYLQEFANVKTLRSSFLLSSVCDNYIKFYQEIINS